MNREVHLRPCGIGLSLKIIGDRLEASFDGVSVLSTRDDTFTGAGKVGLWTKADSLTHFSELTIRRAPPVDEAP